MIQIFFARFAGWNLACYLLLLMLFLEVQICSTEESSSSFLRNVQFLEKSKLANIDV